MATVDPSPDKIEAISCNRSGVMRRRGWDCDSLDTLPGYVSWKLFHRPAALALEGIIGRLVPESAVILGRGNKLLDQIRRAGAGGAGVGPENAWLNHPSHLGGILTVADMVIPVAAVVVQGKRMAVLCAFGHYNVRG